jgi:hypothetical protein
LRHDGVIRKGKHPAGGDVHGMDAISKMVKAINATYATTLPSLARRLR